MEQLWCEGVAQSGARPLLELELAAVRAARSRAFLHSGMAVAGAVLWVAGGIGLELGPVIVTGILLGLPAGVLLARDRLRAASALGADLKGGQALRFGELEVLPQSRRALPDLRGVSVGSAAPSEVVAEPGARRDLNPAERIELRNWIVRRKGTGWGNIVGLFFIGAFIFVFVFPVHIGRVAEATSSFLLAITPMAFSAVLVMRRIGLWWFARNLKAAYVEGDGATERLRSGRIWSENGRPARWRLR